MSHTLRRSPRINRKRNRDSYDNDDLEESMKKIRSATYIMINLLQL